MADFYHMTDAELLAYSEAQGPNDGAVFDFINECAKRFLVGVKTRNDKFLALKPGDAIYYADFDSGAVEKGMLTNVYFSEGRVDSFGVEFADDDWDLFDGSGLGEHYFTTEEDARTALTVGKKNFT